MELHASIREDDDGTLWAEVTELPGCFASGATISELTEALIEAVGMCVEGGLSTTRERARVEQMTLVTGSG